MRVSFRNPAHRAFVCSVKGMDLRDGNHLGREVWSNVCPGSLLVPPRDKMACIKSMRTASAIPLKAGGM